MADRVPSNPSGLPPSPKEPTGWIEDDTFKKSTRRSKDFAERPEHAEARARVTGWQPRRRPYWLGADHSSHNHNALQQFGIGVGHEWYEEMMEMITGQEVQSCTKIEIVKRFGIHKILGNKAIDYMTLGDVLSLVYLKHICLKTYVCYGKGMMEGPQQNPEEAARSDSQEVQVSSTPPQLSRQMRMPPWTPSGLSPVASTSFDSGTPTDSVVSATAQVDLSASTLRRIFSTPPQLSRQMRMPPWTPSGLSPVASTSFDSGAPTDSVVSATAQVDLSASMLRRIFSPQQIAGFKRSYDQMAVDIEEVD